MSDWFIHPAREGGIVTMNIDHILLTLLLNVAGSLIASVIKDRFGV